MQVIERKTSSLGVNRVIYLDDDGALKEHIVEEKHEATVDYAQQMAAEFRAHQGGEVREIASIPNALMLKWLDEEGVPGFCGHEAMDMLINKKLRDPQYSKLLTVPPSYRIQRYDPA